jgi:hypothetical protein
VEGGGRGGAEGDWLRPVNKPLRCRQPGTDKSNTMLAKASVVVADS